MKKYLFSTLALMLMPFYPALAQIKTGLPGITATSNPADFIKSIYGFALLIGGVLALGAIVYGGIRYMTAAGNPSSQSEGKEWIKGSIFGLLLLFGAYAVLNFINPDITTLSLPTLSPIPASQAPSGGGGGGYTDAQARELLIKNGVGGKDRVTLNGVQPELVARLIALKQACGSQCAVLITSSTGDSHEAGRCSHSGGFKADIRPDENLDNFITTRYTKAGKWQNGAQLYRDQNGVIYADERNISGVVPHWDMAVC